MQGGKPGQRIIQGPETFNKPVRRLPLCDQDQTATLKLTEGLQGDTEKMRQS
jgi:hypothetical protein